MCFPMLCNILNNINELKNTYYRISFFSAHTNLSISSYKFFPAISLTNFNYDFPVWLILHFYIYLKIISDKLDAIFFRDSKRVE